MRPLIGLATTKVEIDLAFCHYVVDFGFRLAEDADSIARRPQRAFGGLLVGNPLLQVLLGNSSRLIEHFEARQSMGRQIQYTSRSYQGGLSLHQVGAVDRKERLTLLDFVTDLAEQPVDFSLILREDLKGHVLVEVYTSNSAFLDREHMVANGLDLDRIALRLG